MKKSMYSVWIVLVIGISLITISAFGTVQEQEFQTLELVKVYESEDELRATHPGLFPTQTIRDEGDTIVFSDSNTRQVVKQLQKRAPEVLREEQQKGHIIVWEKFYDYQILNNPAFMLYTEHERGYPKGDPNADPPTLRKGPQRRILYNGNGEVLTELPLSLNYVEVSPNGQYFVATQDSSMPSDFIYFYDMRGTLLKKHPINAYVGLEYSSNSEYVKVRTSSSTMDTVYLFNKMGDLLTRFNYRANFHENLFNFYVSNNAELFLFSMFKNAYLIMKNEKILWKKPYTGILKCRFHSEKQYLILYSMIDNKPLNKSRKAINIVSLRDGELTDSIEDVELIQFTQNGFVIKKEGSYYEYTK